MINITGLIIWFGLTFQSLNVTDLNLDAGPLSFENVTSTSFQIVWRYGGGLEVPSQVLIDGVTGCAVDTSWIGYSFSMLSQTDTGCMITVDKPIIVDGYSNLFAGQIADSNHFTLHYALADTAPVPETSPWLLFVCGIALILRNKWRFV